MMPAFRIIHPWRTIMRQVLGLVFLVVTAGVWAADEPKPLTPEEAAKQVDKDCLVEMKIKAVGMSKGPVYFLNSESDFRSEKNFTVFLGKDAVEKLKKAGVEDPKAHYLDKTIRVQGKVKLYREKPEIVVEDPEKQIKIVEKK
jgi:hypothetical protein